MGQDLGLLSLSYLCVWDGQGKSGASLDLKLEQLHRYNVESVHADTLVMSHEKPYKDVN